ncbi:MAG: NAD-dependent epimerase/dehydratase family protein, partial [Candidatus Dormibacteria bacterium]
MNVLVTGASGFIGRPVVALLLERGHHVHVVSRRQFDDPRCVAHHADLHEFDAADRLLAKAKPNVVIHLAWEVTPSVFWEAPTNLDWLASSVHLARAAIDGGCSAIVAAGSCSENLHFSEASPNVLPAATTSTLYTAAKIAFRVAAEQYSKQRNVRFAWGRVFYPFGSSEPSSKLVSTIARTLRNGQPVVLREPFRRIDYIHVSDVASGFVALATNCGAEGIYDIGTGTAVSLLEIALTIAAILGADPTLVIAHETSSAGPNMIGDPAPLRSTGWTPRYSLKAGLE